MFADTVVPRTNGDVDLRSVTMDHRREATDVVIQNDLFGVVEMREVLQDLGPPIDDPVRRFLDRRILCEDGYHVVPSLRVDQLEVVIY